MYNHNKAQQSKNPCAYFLGYTVVVQRTPLTVHIIFHLSKVVSKIRSLNPLQCLGCISCAKFPHLISLRAYVLWRCTYQITINCFENCYHVVRLLWKWIDCALQQMHMYHLRFIIKNVCFHSCAHVHWKLLGLPCGQCSYILFFGIRKSRPRGDVGPGEVGPVKNSAPGELGPINGRTRSHQPENSAPCSWGTRPLSWRTRHHNVAVWHEIIMCFLILVRSWLGCDTS